MAALSGSRISEIASGFPRATIVVVGDLMLDRFVWGDVSRISPEAPVPIVRVRRETATLGGAGNVAANIVALGGAVRSAGLVGEDEAGGALRERLAALGADTSALIASPGRQTTLKTRVIAHNQQVVRVDREDDEPLPEPLQRQLAERAASCLAGAGALVVSDYDKGVIGPIVLERVLGEARRLGLPSVVDPKLTHFAGCQPATVLTPNQQEAGRATALEIRNEDDVERAGRRILEMLRIDSVLVTRGPAGMALFERGRPTTHVPARAREVYDVTGAGDTVAATLALALTAGADLRESAELSNIAAGLVVGKLGTASVTVSELLGEVS